MEEIVIVLRYMQLYSHQAHNLVKGKTFFQDHDFLGEIYPAYEKDYDDVVERSIWIGKPVNIMQTNQKASGLLSEDSELSIESCLRQLLSSEKFLCSAIEEVKDEFSEGTRQMLGNIADKSEVRQYKLKQRIAG